MAACEAYLWWQPRASPGFDGWLQLVREEFETEDQAIEGEKSRLRAIGRTKRRMLEACGVNVDTLRLGFDCGIVFSPPEEGDERECVMCMCRPRQVRFGCGHRVLCEGCLRHLLARAEPSCPCCCQPVSEDLVVADYMVSHEKKTASLRMARLTDFLPCPPANLSVSRSFKLPWE